MNRPDLYLIPDTQVKEKVENPLYYIAKHLVELKPKNLLHGGDHWDFPALSKYDKGKKSHRAKTYLNDVRAGNSAMQEFFEVLDREWPEHKTECKKIILQGNHEHRRHRALEYGPDELISLIEEFPLDYRGWDNVIPFLKEVKFQGIVFSHYFQQDNSANAISSAQALLNKRHVSCIAFHKQGFDYKEALTAGGRRIQCLIIGSCYFHDESYKTHTNHHWRGSVVLRDVKNGMFDFERFNLLGLRDKFRR